MKKLLLLYSSVIPNPNDLERIQELNFESSTAVEAISMSESEDLMRSAFTDNVTDDNSGKSFQMFPDENKGSSALTSPNNQLKISPVFQFKGMPCSFEEYIDQWTFLLATEDLIEDEELNFDVKLVLLFIVFILIA